MINVKGTIFDNLKKGFNKLRLLADNNIKLFKKILFLAVLDDIYDWSAYLDKSQAIQKKLQEMRVNFILCNRDLDVCRFSPGNEYVNVNTPQTNNTWKRVWDSENLKDLDSSKIGKYIWLTDLNETKIINGKKYLVVNDLSINDQNQILIMENKVNNKHIIR